MSTDWTTKEKITLLSNVLQFGDQPESWSPICNDLLRTFPTKKEGRYSIKNCKREYKYLVDLYKSQWIEHGSSNGLKLPLPKYIWMQLKSTYKSELIYRLKESRKQLTDVWIRIESAVHLKSNTIEPTPPPSVAETTPPIPTISSQENDQHDQNLPAVEIISQSNKVTSDIPFSEYLQSNVPSESHTVPPLSDSLNEQISVSDQIRIKEEPHSELVHVETHRQPSSSISPKVSRVEHDVFQHISPDTLSSSVPFDPQSTMSVASTHLPPLIPESASSSRSTSRTSSETKVDVVKVIPTTTPKYHVYFSPKNSISNHLVANKSKPKRKAPDDLKDDNEMETTTSVDLSTSLSTEQTKPSTPTAAPITRRSINTRSVPNTAAEQEEEKSRRFSAMISENPNCWQSQSMAIIQFLLTHKEGYLFEHEIIDEIAPKYHQFIRRPIALDTIRRNLESNEYSSKEYFKRDIYLMLYNAMKYNPRHHHVHRAARHLFNLTNPLFHQSSQDIQGHITRRNSLSNTSDSPLVKRKRTKIGFD